MDVADAFPLESPAMRLLISLYTGAGGLDLGLEAAGFDVAVAVEMDRDAVDVLRLNRPSWTVVKDGGGDDDLPPGEDRGPRDGRRQYEEFATRALLVARC